MNPKRSLVFGLCSALVLTGVLGASPAQADDGLKESVEAVEKVAPADPQGSTKLSINKKTIKTSSNAPAIRLLDAKKPLKEKANNAIAEGKNVNFVARPTSDGYQVLSVSKRGVTQFKYQFPGKYLEKIQGGYVVVRESKHSKPIALIDPAWAKDAKGKKVASSYTIKGDKLTQTIKPTENTTYPVVADPRVVRKWWGYQVQFTRYETGLLGAGGSGCGIVAALTPHPAVKTALVVGCGTLVVQSKIAQARGECSAFNYYPYVSPGGTIVPWISRCYQ